jgi:amidohydrolase
MNEALTFKELTSEGQLIEPWLVAIRRDLHSNPELSLLETETSAKVAEQLSTMGYKVQTAVGGHGVVADLVGALPGPMIALRADMDALPIQEETGLPFGSQKPGVMHACGHDAHTSMLLGAARLLLNYKDQLAGTVRFIFQAAEEVNAGAKLMVDEGVLEGVQEIYGLHNLPTLAAGKVATRYGSLMGSVDRFELTIEGKGGHGAIPDSSIDPLVAASAVVMGLQTAVSREISPFDPVVVTVGSMQAGDSYNVIPHRAELTGTVRTFSAASQRTMQERLQRMAEQVAAGYRCTAKLTYTEMTSVLVNTDSCVAHVEQTVDELIGSSNRLEAAPTLAGEDFSVYLQHVLGCFFWLGSGPAEGAEKAYGLHHPKFDINENCLPLGASILAAIACRRLNGKSI